MGTNTTTSGGNRPYAPYQRGAQPAYDALGDTFEHGARLKRLVLVGAFVSFVSLFGLTVAFDYQTQHGQTALQPVIVTSSQPVVNGNVNSSTSAVPQIRTKTS